MLRKCVIANLLFLVVCGTGLWAQPRCIRPAQGVPGHVLSGLPPNWWNSALGFPRWDERVDAPSWQGATAHSHPFGGNGTVEDMQFRAAHATEGGVQYIYLSWVAKVVPDLNALGKNAVWFGFGTPAGTSAVAIKIQLDQNTSQTASTLNNHVKQIRVFDGTNWSAYTPSGGATSFPPWLLRESGTPNAVTDNTARLWIREATLTEPNLWAVQVRVPISAAATNSNLDSGVNIGTQFKLWYELRISTPSDPDKGYATYKWPTGIPDTNEVTDDPPPLNGTPAPNVTPPWDTFKFTNAASWEPPDPTCLTDGVSLKGQDIGSNHPSGSTYISLTNPNVFYARPFNHHTTAPANNVKARFRIANWGSGPTREDVPSPSTTLWQDIDGPGGVPQPTGITISPSTQGNITTSYSVTTLCDRCRYQVFYAAPANKPTCDLSCPAADNGKRATHQCLLVELTGVGVNFLNNSAWQNMNYATTSTFSDPAQINISELPALAGGKDVYLYVRALNMPNVTRPGTPGIGKLPIPGWPPPADPPRDGPGPVRPPPGNDDVAGVAVPGQQDPEVPATRSQQLISGLQMALAQDQIDFDQLSQSMPTLTVHAYYDSGLRNTAGGGSRPILRPLTSFGYFVVHDGEVGGWNYGLQGAQLIAPNWYKVAVGSTGLAEVTTTIQALEVRRFSAGLRLGVGLPHGSFNNTFDAGFALDADLEYAVSSTFALQAVFGFSHFGASGSDPVDVTRLSVNPKVYLGTATTRLFFNAGVGFYSFDPGSTEFGSNVGLGVQHFLSPRLAIEGAYNYHLVDVSGGSTAFSTIECGVRLRF